MRLDHLLSKRKSRGCFIIGFSKREIKSFRWRCVQGKHPSTSRTRWLRPVRPRVLHWRRCGRLGGCRIKLNKQLRCLFGGVAQLGEHLPCKQGVMSSNLTISTRIYGFESAKFTWMITYLDNFTLIKIIKETYVDLIVTDIRFYQTNTCIRFDNTNQFKQQTKS